jgi:ABC-type antimicrobial peptide transport system permease subunit
VVQRPREIGIRMALGADQARIGRMVIGDALRIAAAGIALGLAGALPLAWATRRVLHGVGPMDPPTIAAALGVIALCAAAAGYLPARRAARVDPMTVLRSLLALAPLPLTL